MPKYTDLATKTGDRVLSLIGDAQGVVVSAVSTVSSAIGSVIPELPALPLAENVPAPRELVDDYFSFAERALKQQKTYAKDLVKALEPVSTKILPNGKKSVKAAPKAAATA
jgi:hypothetical protein